MSTTAPEYLATLRDGVTEAVQQWMDQSTSAWDQWARAWTPTEGMAPWPSPARATTSAHPARHEGRHDHEHEHRHDHDHGTDERGSRRSQRADGCGCGAESSGCGCGGREAGCGCGDPCRCCVPAADVIVHARVGEVRVVPFHLRNPWRRERPVSLEVGPWHGCDGDGLSVRAVLEEESIVLAPCEDRVVRLLVAVRPTRIDDGTSVDGTSVDGNPDGTEPKGAATATDAAAAASRDEALKAHAAGDAVRGDGQGRDIGDVEGCATAYADVRFEGCARPQRVALVVLPAECDAVDVGCDCGCC